MALTTDQLKKYWDSANVLRKNLDAAEYKHIVLGLVFLKYVSDSFAERRDELSAAFSDPKSDRYKPDAKRLKAALDDRNYYKEVNVFWVPESSRWEVIQQNAKQADIASQIDNALYEIEKENPKLEGIVERRYADAKLPAADLGAVVDLIGSISFGNNRREASDVLGQVYEYFLGMFASAEGKLGGQFYTTPSIVKTLVEVLQPTSGRIYDPCCGSGGMFVQSERFLEAHGGKLGDIAIYGQESNPTTRRLCAMNLAIRGIDFDLGKSHGDTFTEDQHPDKRFDFILMNPPFGSNASYPKEQLINDVRWKKYGIPRERPANYAWMSHAVHHLAPKGRAGIVMPKNTLNSEQGSDLQIRTAFLDSNIVECIIEMPGNLFFNTSIPCAIWFFNNQKQGNTAEKILFIDATKLGRPISKTQIEFSEEDVSRITSTYNNWRKGIDVEEPGWSTSATRDQIEKNGDSLSPARYVSESENQKSRTSEELIDSALSRISSQIKLLEASSAQLSTHINQLKSSKQLRVRRLKLEKKPLTYSDSVISNSLSASTLDLSRGLFKAFFLDFSILDGAGEFKSLTTKFDLAKYYDSKMLETAVGVFPTNWKMGTLGDIAEVVDCLHSKKPELLQEGKPYIQLKCIREDGTFDLNQIDYISSSDYDLWTSRIEVQEGDCIITNVGRVGAVAQIPPGFRGAIGRNITALRPKKEIVGASFLAELLFSEFMKKEVRANTDSGTVLDALNVRRISAMRTFIPPSELLVVFEEIVNPLRMIAAAIDHHISSDLRRAFIES